MVWTPVFYGELGEHSGQRGIQADMLAETQPQELIDLHVDGEIFGGGALADLEVEVLRYTNREAPGGGG